MKIVKKVSCSRVLCDKYPLNSKTFEMAEALKKGMQFKPIKVMKLSDGRYFIKDGRHRYVAHRLNDISDIEISFNPEISRNDSEILALFDSDVYTKLRRLI